LLHFFALAPHVYRGWRGGFALTVALRCASPQIQRSSAASRSCAAGTPP